jgi:hypothetical protein
MRALILSAALGLTCLAITGPTPAHAQAVYGQRPAVSYGYPPAYSYPPGVSYYPGAGYVSYYAAPAYTSRYYFPTYYAPTSRTYYYAQPVNAPGYPGYYQTPGGYYGPAPTAYDFWSGQYYGR